MKRCLSLLSALAVLGLAGFLFSCQNGAMETTEPAPNPFIGTWENERARYVFTETRLTITLKDNDSITFDGPYTYDDIHIVHHQQERINITHYWLKDDVLFINESNRELTRQDSP